MPKSVLPVHHRTAAVATGFLTGLASIVSISGVAPARSFPVIHRSAAEALRGDWTKLGGDMRRAVKKVAPGGEG